MLVLIGSLTSALTGGGCATRAGPQASERAEDTTAATSSTTSSATTTVPPTATIATTAPPTPVPPTTAPPTTAPSDTTAPALVPGQPCDLGSHPNCIDPDGDGAGTYLLFGADCMGSFPDAPELCTDLDQDGTAGYPDSG